MQCLYPVKIATHIIQQRGPTRASPVADTGEITEPKMTVDEKIPVPVRPQRVAAVDVRD